MVLPSDLMATDFKCKKGKRQGHMFRLKEKARGDRHKSLLYSLCQEAGGGAACFVEEEYYSKAVRSRLDLPPTYRKGLKIIEVNDRPRPKDDI